MNKKVVVYSTASCPYCVRAKNLLAMKNVSFEEIRIDLNPALREEMESLSKRRSVPQIFIGGRHVGGFDDLNALNDSGELDKWLDEI